MISSSSQTAISTARIAAAPPLHRLIQLTVRRFFTTAGEVQPQLDPDYDYDENSFNNQRFTAPVADTEESVPTRGVQWSFIGCPLAKKRVYAEKLAELLEVPYISMTSLVRQELNPRSSIYKQIANAVNRRELVPEDIIFGLLSKRLEDGFFRGETGFILDGIPRTRIQAEILDQLAEIDLVVNFKCPDHYLEKHQEGAWSNKLRAYIEQTKLLEDYYGKQKKLLNFQVSSAPKETWRGLLAALHIRHTNAVML